MKETSVNGGLEAISPIGVFDSGIGGLSVANEIVRLLPNERLLYVADNAYAPYGPRSAAEILTRSRLLTTYLLGRGVKLVVVACNTATAYAIDALREEHPEMNFVGLEPAVKPAAEAQRIGVMATAATLKSSRYHALRERYLAGRLVVEDACAGLVPLIEGHASEAARLRSALRDILQPMLAKAIDALVLGCTHYPLVKAEIAAICGPAVSLIDPSPAAALQVERMLVRRGLLLPAKPGTCARAHDFLATGTTLALQQTLFSLPALNRRRRLLVPGLRLGE